MTILESTIADKAAIAEEGWPQAPYESAREQSCLLKLIKFWAVHPYASFNRLALFHNLDYNKDDVERALRNLINRKVIIPHLENGTPVYSLTADEPLRSSVLSLAAHSSRCSIH